MKYLIVAIATCMGCSNVLHYRVACEKPYYSGPAAYASTNDDGTTITTYAHEYLEYPPSVKCQISTYWGPRTRGLFD